MDHLERVIAYAPPACLVRDPCQPVRDDVDVGRDVDVVDLGVVSGIYDRSETLAGDALKADEQLGPSDSTCKRSDIHEAASVVAPTRMWDV